MTWVQIQKATETSWDEYERGAKAMALEDNPPEGLLMHAAGEENGKWRSVDIWESEAAFERFRDEQLFPALREVMGEDVLSAGPPSQESFEVKHFVKP